MSRRIAAGVAAGSALVLSLTGCMGDSGQPASTDGMRLSAAQAVANTSQKTGQADSFKADLTVDGKSADGATKIHVTGQFKTRPALAFTARLDQASHGGQSLPGGAQAVLVDNALYVKQQQLSQLTGGRPWLKIDLNRAARDSGLNLNEMLSQVQKVDPAEQTKMFTASKDVRTVGKESVDGVQTTHYTGTFTMQEALKQFDASTRAKIEKAYPHDAAAAGEKVNFDLWTDGAELPRKLVSTFDQGKGESVKLTILYRDYGKAVNVTAPPAGDVQDFDLGRLMGGRQG